MEDLVRILLISGSLRAGSTNTAVLETAREVAPEAVTAVLYDGMAGLPHFNPDDDREGQPVGDAGTYGKPVAWINAAGPAAPTGAADAHDSLRKVLGYVHADIVEGACVRLALTRDLIGPDGLVGDRGLREKIADAVAALARHVRERDTP